MSRSAAGQGVVCPQRHLICHRTGSDVSITADASGSGNFTLSQCMAIGMMRCDVPVLFACTSASPVEERKTMKMVNRDEGDGDDDEEDAVLLITTTTWWPDHAEAHRSPG